MKTESYILRFGDTTQIRELARDTLDNAGILCDTEVDAFVIKAGYAQQMAASAGSACMSVKIINQKLYISGEANGLMFTI